MKFFPVCFSFLLWYSMEGQISSSQAYFGSGFSALNKKEPLHLYI